MTDKTSSLAVVSQRKEWGPFGDLKLMWIFKLCVKPLTLQHHGECHDIPFS